MTTMKDPKNVAWCHYFRNREEGKEASQNKQLSNEGM